jgi:hypothetical protein
VLGISTLKEKMGGKTEKPVEKTGGPHEKQKEGEKPAGQ